MSLFISMEGPDGSGKTLQMDLLEKALAERGLSVLRSREPGGTVIGEKIRDVILDPSGKEMDPVTEAYLYAASRAQHVAEKIRPAVPRMDFMPLPTTAISARSDSISTESGCASL